MRILMLGWEFPPFIAGGLGTACYGLTKALDQAGHHVLFVLPRPIHGQEPSHLRMLTPATLGRGLATPENPLPPPPRPTQGPLAPGTSALPTSRPLYGFEHTTFIGVDATFSHPYPSFDSTRPLTRETDSSSPRTASVLPRPGQPASAGVGAPPPLSTYGLDLVNDAERYARLVVALTRREVFDIIHAHDWLTFPAGLAVSKVSGKPLVVHVHSTEFDRAGANVNQRVYEIERSGMHAADRVLAVSEFTKSICVKRYGVAPDKIDVAYNGIDREAVQPKPEDRIESRDHIVLFLGRITMQKGPEYFIAAAKRVLEKMSNVKFVLAGSGDMAIRMIELAAGAGIGHKVLFTGFLRGPDVDRIFQMADCYVMPSVSEPFGIAALEAIKHDVPVILSKTSGASEVLKHVLKVDFWDIDDMANKIIAVLRHPPLARTLREHGAIELQRLTWSGAAERCLESYSRAIADRAKETAAT